MNDYLRQVMGDAFTASDFRTWAGTTHAAARLLAVEPAEDTSQREREATVAATMSRGGRCNSETRAPALTA